MEIARLEVSTQQHLERMQETAKVHYIQYGKIHQGQEGEETSLVQGQVVQGQAATGAPNPVEKAKSLLQTPDTDVGKADTKNHRTAKLWTQHAEECGKKGHYEKVCLKGKCSTHSLEAPQAGSAGGRGQ